MVHSVHSVHWSIWSIWSNGLFGSFGPKVHSVHLVHWVHLVHLVQWSIWSIGSIWSIWSNGPNKPCQKSVPKSVEILNDFSPYLLPGPFSSLFVILCHSICQIFCFPFFPIKNDTNHNEKPFFRMRILKMGEDFSFSSHRCQRLRYSWRSMQVLHVLLLQGISSNCFLLAAK